MIYCVVAALVMSMAWNIRGHYGHCTGAMLCGALLAMFLAIGAGRADWHKRIAIAGLVGAIGWSFGGASSYGFQVGYTHTDSFPDTLYGYANFVLIGGMWGAVGAGLLGLGLTMPRSYLNAFVWPLLAVGAALQALSMAGLAQKLPNIYDSYWVEATAALIVAGVMAVVLPKTRTACGVIALVAISWWGGIGLVMVSDFIAGNGTLAFAHLDDPSVNVNLPALHLNPPRSDSWAGCLGITVGVGLYLAYIRNYAALSLFAAGLLWGGIGFAIGDFVQVLQRAGWGPFTGIVAAHNGWSKMELIFGLIMGFGVALQARKLVKGGVAAPEEDTKGDWLNEFAVFFLCVPMLWWTFGYTNFRAWVENKSLPEILDVKGGTMFPVSINFWLTLHAVLFAAIVLHVLFWHRRRPIAAIPATALGKGSLLFLLLQWAIVGGSFSNLLTRNTGETVLLNIVYFLCAAWSTVYVLDRPQGVVVAGAGVANESRTWLPGWKYAVAWVVVIVAVVGMTYGSVGALDGSVKNVRLRFGPVVAE